MALGASQVYGSAMEGMVAIFGTLLLFAVCASAAVLLLFGLPGTFVIVAAAALYAWLTAFEAVSIGTLLLLFGLAIAGEVAELAAGGGIGADGRPSRRVTVAVILGSLVGGMFGATLFFGLGALPGALLGAFAGAGLAVTSQGGDFGTAVRSGWAALKGRFVGFLMKLAVAVCMIVALAVQIL